MMAQILRGTAGQDAPVPERPELHLSGPRLRQALESLIAGSEEQGGVERYVDALKLKSSAFGDTLAGGAAGLKPAAFGELCALMPSVRRRIGPYLDRKGFATVCTAIEALLDGRTDTTTTDARLAAFGHAFPRDREHRWVRDLAAELLHNLDPERYPPMQRWVWDAKTNTGVLREIWWGDDVDHIMIDVPDSYGAFVMLREELSQFLTENGVFRDILQYVDLLLAHVYAGYIGEQGGQYLRTDFATPEDPMLHTRRMLGLDGVGARGRTKPAAVDGDARPVGAPRLLN
ncbi:MAG: hypothetical protein F4204_12935 [Rhodospirillaceae bacterium]|nr:hypothetical protein [Rhodospirillaceae bacterium]